MPSAISWMFVRDCVFVIMGVPANTPVSAWHFNRCAQLMLSPTFSNWTRCVRGNQDEGQGYWETLMSMISLRQLLDHAAEHAYGVPAFNINNMEQMQAIMQAADETDSPVILQASAGARKYAGEAFLRHMTQAAAETWPHTPIVMHQDHGASLAVCQASIRSGFTSVMMDGSLREDMKTPATYEYNVEVTA